MLIALFAAAVIAPPLSADLIKADVRVLWSDTFVARGPGERGEAKTVAYIARAFAAAGFASGGRQTIMARQPRVR